MTYDFHGVWDKPETPSKWVVPLLNAHTNLTEIKGAMDLLWRNGISSDKVTLGMAFYGRAFTASSPSCLTPGCTFESGANAQLCSREVGIILNSELDQLISSRQLTPTLDEAAAVKLLTWDSNKWVAYDDGDTFALKAKFARSQCLGGLMVWTVSHDTEDAKYSQLLGNVAKRKFNAVVRRNVGDGTGEDDGYEYTAEYKQQCRWTGCNENCPSGWIRMLRKDSGARGEEYMVDETGCGGYGQHQLCCPPSQTPPTCGWYTHNNGRCANKCPDGTREIGSNAKYCHLDAMGGFSYHTYQAACCTTGTENMKLYDQCDWTAWPFCNSVNTCPGNQTIVASSWTGSGDAMCIAQSKREYCCDNNDENSQWSECAWHSDLSQSSTTQPADFCHANCPQDTVRVAMDQTGCSGGSASAECCTPNIKTISKRQSGQDAEYEYYLERFLASPICANSGIYEHWDFLGILIRDLLAFNAESYTVALVTALFWGSPTVSQKDLWNRQIAAVTQFTSLSYANLHDYLMSSEASYIYVSAGSTQGAEYIVCNLNLLASQVANWLAGKGGGGGGGGSTVTCVCVRSDCCAEEDSDCIGFDAESEFSKRGLPVSPAKELDKRGKARSYMIKLNNHNTAPITVLDYPWEAPTYPSTGQFTSPRDNAILSEAWDFDPNCPQFRPRSVSLTPVGTTSTSGFDSEHVFERNAIPKWSQNAVDGVLADRATPFKMNGVQYLVPLNFFTHTLFHIVNPQAGPAAGGAPYTDFRSRIMNALGSTQNRAVMSLVRKQMNLMKEQMWAYEDNEPVKRSLWRIGCTARMDKPQTCRKRCGTSVMSLPHSNSTMKQPPIPSSRRSSKPSERRFAPPSGFISAFSTLECTRSTILMPGWRASLRIWRPMRRSGLTDTSTTWSWWVETTPRSWL
ncbi:glycoside hydrolase family 45 protein, partial [Canariomyces notabilis]